MAVLWYFELGGSIIGCIYEVSTHWHCQLPVWRWHWQCWWLDITIIIIILSPGSLRILVQLTTTKTITPHTQSLLFSQLTLLLSVQLKQTQPPTKTEPKSSRKQAEAAFYAVLRSPLSIYNWECLYTLLQLRHHWLSMSQRTPSFSSECSVFC